MVCHSCCQKQKYRKGLWSPEEDQKLRNYITKYGHGCWGSVPKQAGLQRCGKSCRLRWINYLRPGLKRGGFSPQEEKIIIDAHAVVGNRWSQIASQLPGRTDNEIKNFWNSCIKKKLRQLGIDPNTHKPLRGNSTESVSNNNNDTSSSSDVHSNSASGIEIAALKDNSALQSTISLPKLLFSEWFLSDQASEPPVSDGNLFQVSAEAIDSQSHCSNIDSINLGATTSYGNPYLIMPLQSSTSDPPDDIPPRIVSESLMWQGFSPITASEQLTTEINQMRPVLASTTFSSDISYSNAITSHHQDAVCRRGCCDDSLLSNGSIVHQDLPIFSINRTTNALDLSEYFSDNGGCSNHNSVSGLGNGMPFENSSLADLGYS